MPRPKKTPQSKVAFVRALPETLSAKEVSEKAKGAGLKITPGYVYEIRSSAKRRAAKTGQAAPTAPAGRDAAFRKMVIDLGLERAKALLLQVETALRALTA